MLSTWTIFFILLIYQYLKKLKKKLIDDFSEKMFIILTLKEFSKRNLFMSNFRLTYNYGYLLLFNILLSFHKEAS